MNDQASVRYLVHQVDDTAAFYIDQLDFEVVFDASPISSCCRAARYG